MGVNGDPMEVLAAAVMDADPERGPATALADALLAAAAAGTLPPALAAEAEPLARALRAERPAEAIARVSALLEAGQEPPAPAPAPGGTGAERADRDEDTIELVGDFLDESTDGLARADEILLAVARSGPDADGTNALFRVFHTIKGVAGFLELREVVTLSHATETLLNAVREGRLPLSGPPFELVLEATALLRTLLARLRQAVEKRAALVPDAAVAGLVDRLGAAVTGAAAVPLAPGPASRPPAADADADPWPERAPAASGAPTATPTATSTPTSTPTATATATAPATGEPVADDPASPREADVSRVVSRPAARDDGANGANGAKLRETVKVDLERVNTMLEMLGELIIVGSMVVHAPEVARTGSRRLRNDLNQLGKISRDLQAVAMRMRMVPVRGCFGKIARLVHDLARRTGKDVVLETSGEDTELDRSMVERIEDPLVHLVRNAMDHGVEPAEARRAAGKPARSTLRLSAFHEGGTVVVELSDDGGGLRRDKILARARERHLVDPARELTDDEIHALIFLPGFSTAERVTEISGRGVGMDVVKRAVEAMRGRVSVASRAGQGTTFRLVLPLTLAIIDGMLVSCGGERYIVPSLAIVETLRPAPGMVSRLPGRGELLTLRGEHLPLLRLRDLLEISGKEPPLEQGRIVVVEGLGRKVGLAVDDVLAQQQVVIKPLGGGVGEADVLSGAAILSDGRVGLILNVDRVAQRGARVARSRAGAAPVEAAGV